MLVWTLTCILALAAFLFQSPQVSAADLTDGEIEKFKTLLETGTLAPILPGPLTDKEMSSLADFSGDFEGLRFGGYLDTYYQYESVNPPAGDSVAIHPKYFARQVNSFTVNNIQTWLYKTTPHPGDVGFKIVLDWGELARHLTSVGPVNDDGAVQPNPPGFPNGARQTTFKEAYAQWNAPVGKGLTIKFGKFQSWLGYEWWETIWNPNFSGSYTDFWLIPGNGTGIGLGYDITDKLSANYYFVNTTDTFVNNNKNFSHGIDINYNLPNTGFFKNGYVNFGTLWGCPHPSNSSDWLQVYDLTLQFSPFEKITLATTTNWQYDPKAIVQPSGRAKRGNQSWGIAQYFIYEHSDRLGFAIRGEYYWDHDNLSGISGGGGASLTEVTGTLNVKLHKKLMVRPEIRYDKIIHMTNASSHIWHGQNKNITFLIGMSYEF